MTYLKKQRSASGCGRPTDEGPGLNFSYLINNRRFSDVDLVANTTRVHAHEIVLSHWSSELVAQIQQDSSDNNNKGRVIYMDATKGSCSIDTPSFLSN